MRKILFVLFSLTFLLINENFAQNNTYEFLRIDMSARAGALAGTFVSNNDDPNVIFYNPAGLSLLQDNPISFSFVKHLLDINLASLSASEDLEGIGRVGGAIKYINYGTFTEANQDGKQLGQFGAGEVAFILGYSNALDVNFYYGANIKFIYSSIADRSSSALGFDVGLHYAFPQQQIDIGAAITNIGSQLSSYYSTKESLPTDITIGVSKRLEYLPLRLSLDFHRLNEQRDNFTDKFKAFTIGAEFTLSKVFRLRFGYDNEKRSELKVGSFAGIAGFNAGIGAVISNYRFDYGFSSLGPIGELHRISISTNL